MIIQIDRKSSINIKEPKDFKKFKVQIEDGAESFEIIRSAVSNIIAFDNREEAWVLAAALYEWPQLRDDPEWRTGLDAMIAKARPHGWIREIPLSIKAHIEWIGARGDVR